MPDYYDNGNRVLGPRPTLSAHAPQPPNGLLAAVILLACAAAVAALIALRPANSPTPRLGASVAYLLVTRADGGSAAGTGFIAPGGRLVTSRDLVLTGAPPAAIRIVFADGAETAGQLAAHGDAASTDLAARWATLTGATGPPLTASATPLAEGARVIVAGYDLASQALEVVRFETTVAGVRAGAAGVESCGLARTPPAGFDGAPVLDEAGQVVGLWLAGAGQVLPLDRLPRDG